MYHGSFIKKHKYIAYKTFNIFGMITAKEVHVLDINAEYHGVPTVELMENAGRGTAEFIHSKLKSEQKTILVICGTGNNGGDGFVTARYLATRYKVSIFLAGKDVHTDISRDNLRKVDAFDVKIYSDLKGIDTLLQQHDVLIDAMLGIGLEGSLKEPYTTLVKKINAVKKKIVVSVDVPTGLGTDLAVKPTYTVTFHDIKEGMTAENCGEIHIVDIGIPQAAIKYVGPGELSVYYPRPKKQSHKGDNGSVLVIGGGPYIGAPALTGMGALRTGTDLVFIATPKRSFPFVARFSPNFIVKDLRSDILTVDDVPVIQELLSRCTAVAIGPGLGSATETREAVVHIIKQVTAQKIPLVIDADAIEPIGKNKDIIRQTKTILTPHAGEFKKLTGINIPEDIDERVRVVHQLAQSLNVGIFLKGYIDIISDGKNYKQNIVHNEAMTVGGTGDVLTGIIAALLSKGVEPFNAMRIAAFLNGEAGNEAFKKKSYGLVATDIVEEIPGILTKYL
jgi:NAD(P)H-hydrate epimerase